MSSAGPEYGTAEAGWKAALVEADQRCELHLKVRDNLMNDVHAKVKQWQKDNYHKVSDVLCRRVSGGSEAEHLCPDWLCIVAGFRMSESSVSRLSVVPVLSPPRSWTGPDVLTCAHSVVRS